MRLDIKAVRHGDLMLHPITEANIDSVLDLFRGYPDADAMRAEIDLEYGPRYDDQGRQTNYGFYTTLRGDLVGASLLGISDWRTLCGNTGADTLLHMRGRGIAPASKPALFHVGFQLLGLHRIETGCFVSNLASRRSIEKTPGFVHEGTFRESGINDHGEFEDELRYSILRRDWERLYRGNEIEVVS